MVKLSLGQRKISAEILGNIAVGWFIAGVVTPILAGPENIFNTASYMILSLVMTGVFAAVALLIARKIKT